MRFILSIVLLLGVTPFTRNHPIGLPGHGQHGGPGNFNYPAHPPSVHFQDDLSRAEAGENASYYNAGSSMGPTGADVVEYLRSTPDQPNTLPVHNTDNLQHLEVTQEASDNNSKVLTKIRKLCRRGCSKGRSVRAVRGMNGKKSTIICWIVTAMIVGGVITGIVFAVKESSEDSTSGSNGGGAEACAKGGGRGGRSRGSGHGKVKC